MKAFLINFITLIVVISLSFFLYHKFFSPKIGYIRNGVVLSDYVYMKDVSSRLDQEMKVVKSNLDTLRNRYELLKVQEKSVSPKSKAELSYKLSIAENDFLKYDNNAGQEMAQRQQQLTKEVLDKVNAGIKKYAEENGYKYILGTTKEGSILYGSEGEDLTEEILEKLNSDYQKNAPKK